MFGIIILHEAVPIRVNFMQEWQKCVSEDVNVAARVHDPTEDAYSSSPTKADPCPNVDFNGVFWSVKNIVL